MADSVQTAFTFARLAEPWQVGVLCVLAATAAWAAWRFYGPRAPGVSGRIAQFCRALAMAILVLLLGAPAIQHSETTVLLGEVHLAIDTSASMARGDGPGGATRISAATTLTTMLQADASKRRMRLTRCALSDGAPIIENATLKADGVSSPLGDALIAAITTRRPDVLIAVTDGRVTTGSHLTAVTDRLRGRDLRLAILATGGDRLDPELFIDETNINREVALDELEPISIRLSARALPPGPIRVELRIGDEVVDRAEITPDAALSTTLQALETRLGATFRKEGPARLSIRAEAGGIVRTQECNVMVKEHRLGVLILDRQPRYEMRYLRTALIRDNAATVHTYLGDGRWIRWGDKGPDHLPLSAQELQEYHAIILGDLGPESFRDADLLAIANHVRKGGAGLVLIPGETGASTALARSVLADLLPATLPEAGAISQGYREQKPRYLKRQPIAESLGLLDSGGTAWDALMPLLGAAPCTPRAGADVLARDQDGAELVVARAAGAGRAVMVCVDDTWRWRRGVGDRYLHRFYSQLLRYAAAGRRAGAQPWRLTASPRSVTAGESVAIDLVLAAGVDIDIPETASVRLTGPDQAQFVFKLVRREKGFSTRIDAPTAGTWTVGIEDGPTANHVEPGELLVVASEDERRDPRADRTALDALARATGGQVFTDPAALMASLPIDLGKSESTTAERGLWDTAWTLILLISLLAVDWAIRRRNRLP
ncbi:MAG: hypothetical protein AAB263_12205 [Planctomycetota bacterium]